MSGVPVGLQPIYLFADSQLLFWRDAGGALVLEKAVGRLTADQRRAAYLGASSGDDPRFYGLFEAAMDLLGVTNRRMIPSRPSADALRYLQGCRVILLAGGDVATGWRSFRDWGVCDVVERAHRAGAVLIGISAGAIQLGLGGPFGMPSAYGRPEDRGRQTLKTFGLVPHWVDAHDEANRWRRLREVVSTRVEGTRGVGIPHGSGAVHHPDGRLQALRTPVQQFVKRDDAVERKVLFP